MSDDEQPLRFELAAPTAAKVSGSGCVRAATLRAGRYATLLHVGPFNSDKVTDLGDARTELLDLGGGQGIEWNGSRTAHAMAFEACIEGDLADPRGEPDWSKWETELAYLTSDTP